MLLIYLHHRFTLIMHARKSTISSDGVSHLHWSWRGQGYRCFLLNRKLRLHQESLLRQLVLLCYLLLLIGYLFHHFLILCHLSFHLVRFLLLMSSQVGWDVVSFVSHVLFKFRSVFLLCFELRIAFDVGTGYLGFFEGFLPNELVFDT